MWHCILDIAGAIIMAGIGYFVGKDKGWNHGYRAAWENNTRERNSARLD
jgi:hypothetical protein